MTDLTPVTRKTSYQDLPCYQPGVRVSSPFGPITHWAPGIYRTTKADALSDARLFVRESNEAGYITIAFIS